jgi:hypothetical protein
MLGNIKYIIARERRVERGLLPFKEWSKDENRKESSQGKGWKKG